MNELDARPTLGTITRTSAPMGHVLFSVEVAYPNEPVMSVQFFGFPDVRTGPVVMITDYGQTFVTDPGRFGPFGRAWVGQFFGPRA